MSQSKPAPRVALVGYGPWGRNIARNLFELGALAGVCDSDATRRAEVSSRWPDLPVWADSAELQAALPADVAIAIAAPAARHAELVRFFLLGGRDVFVEKPLALRVDEGEELVRLAAQADRILMIGHLLHYHPVIERLDELVRSGVLGRLRYLYSNRLNLGRFRREENSLWSFAPHDVAVLLRLVGSAPNRVAATGGYFLHPKVADTTLTTLGWDNGVQAHIHVSWLHPFKEQRLVVVGQDAMAVFEDSRADDKLGLYRHGVTWQDGVPQPRKAEREPVAVGTAEPLRHEMEVFLRAVSERLPPISDGLEGLAVLRVLDAAERSLVAGGTPVELEAQAAPWRAHPTAVVGSAASIGAGTRVWHFCHVMDGARIGRDCSLGQGCFVADGAVLGDRVRLQMASRSTKV